MALPFLLFLAFVPESLAATLYNGLQTSIFSSNLSSTCDAALNTSISCPENTIQLVTYGIQAVGDVFAAVEEGCSDFSMNIDNQVYTLTDWIDHMQYKFGLICLTDSDSGDFCLDVEKTWNITEMVLEDEATWPDNTNKCYFDAQSSSWDYITDPNGTCLDPFDFDWANASTSGSNTAKAALDYYIERSEPIDDDNYGWFLPLEFDEYPLEIQCSSCFLQNFQYGLENKWGDVWDNITAQVWENMKLNCGLSYSITPANDFSNVIAYGAELNNTEAPASTCPQNITIEGSMNITCNEAVVTYGISTAGLHNLNRYLFCPALTNITLCAPLSCPITVVNLGENVGDTNNTEVISNWVANYSNFTMTQFLAWNPYLGLDHVTHGTTVCVGPPGGVYVPPSATVAIPSVYSTTATPAGPTPSGTIPNCGLYYNVTDGDYCDLVSQRFSLTFAEFVALNPSIDANCTNLILGDEYCVAAVNGTTATATASTSGATTTSSYVPAPTQTVSGTTPYCYEWYTVGTGGTCYAIEQEYGITMDELIALNTELNAACSNLQLNVAYCVSGVPVTSTSSSVTTTTSSTTSTSAVATPSPIQTGMASGCDEFYQAQSGDGCYDIAAEYGITLDEFYEWNPAVGECTALWPTYWYCVGM